ncbi:MAG: putative nucleic-acid-binding protein [Ilumatobacteraceae bacterium]|nr:putative nucleic-acid-binding protein [Ilumatobacteraceae bacterium]
MSDSLPFASVGTAPATTLTRVPIIDGWFTDDPHEPHLIGSKCPQCGTFVFPPRTGDCPNPACESETLEPTPMSRRGKVWSYTENRYTPPAPYVPTDPFEPYALAAVELEAEGIVVLGKVATGILAVDLKVGMEMQLELDVSHRDDEHEYMVYVWAPATPSTSVTSGASTTGGAA